MTEKGTEFYDMPQIPQTCKLALGGLVDAMRRGLELESAQLKLPTLHMTDDMETIIKTNIAAARLAGKLDVINLLSQSLAIDRGE